MNRPLRPCKKDLKHQKWHWKQEPSSFLQKQIAQQLKNLQQAPSECQYSDPIMRRAMKWWQRVDEKYFKTITPEEVVSKRDMCTCQNLLLIGLPGDVQPTAFAHFRESMVNGVMGNFLDRNRIRVVFKSKASNQTFIAAYGVETAITDYHNDPQQTLNFQGITITPKALPGTRMQNEQELSLSELKQVRLQLQDYEENEIICERSQKIEQVQSNPLYLDEIDKEIALWEWELERANRENRANWDKLIARLQEQESLWKVADMGEFDTKIREYRDKLYWGTVLRSFEHGFKDKTKKMLQTYMENQKNFNLKPPKGLPGSHQKKFFETDCKICFCSDNNDSNQVLYCDSCNTSFHLICYGLTSIPKEEEYFCQRCTYMKKEQGMQKNIKIKKPYCQICLKTSFPMKKLDEHFYHVTCLIIFNFVQFRENKMVLKGSLTHENILKMVIQNEIMHEECNECRKINGGTQLGMQIKCNYEGCENYCHPICGYLNGYKFELKAGKNRNLEVKMFFFSDHLGPRIEQIYLRRYMCNLNETSSKSERQIKMQVETQQQGLSSSKQTLLKTRKKHPNRILYLTKFIKNLLKSRFEKDQQQIETETQAILRKLKSRQTN